MSADIRSMQIGYGHDIHELFAGCPLVLGDALAGAIADGDLGTHFPEDDPEAVDARSLDFVSAFAEHVRQSGFEIINVDSFITLGTTRLRPHILRMRENLAEALAVDLDRVSVKARSKDGLGLEGQGKAASASAVVLVCSSR